MRYWLCPSLLSAHLYGGERLSRYTYWVSCRLSLYYYISIQEMLSSYSIWAIMVR